MLTFTNNQNYIVFYALLIFLRNTKMLDIGEHMEARWPYADISFLKGHVGLYADISFPEGHVGPTQIYPFLKDTWALRRYTLS